MTIGYLVDSDWVIHHLNGHDAVTKRLRDLQPEGLGISILTLAELYEGVYFARDPESSERDLNTFLESVHIVSLDEETVKVFGRERGRLRAVGMLIGDMALLIAATALRHKVVLLTNNRRHFARIETLQIISSS